MSRAIPKEGDYQRRETQYEIRAKSDDDEKRIEGVAIEYNKVAQIYPWFYEKMEPGCFEDSLRDDEQFSLGHHNWENVLGRTGNDTFTLTDTKAELQVATILPDTMFATDLHTSVDRGDICGMSVGFRIRDYQVEDYEAGEDSDSNLYTILRADLLEVSVVTRPAYKEGKCWSRSKPVYPDLSNPDEPRTRRNYFVDFMPRRIRDFEGSK